jgi:uncharacterized RmlC-like cupin family protein
MSNEKHVMVVRPQGPHDTGRGFVGMNSLSGDDVPSPSISIIVGEFPIGHRVTPHTHPYEEIVYLISGHAEMSYGPGLAQKVEIEAGDILYVPEGVLHSPMNPGPNMVQYLVARSGPEEIIIPPSE